MRLVNKAYRGFCDPRSESRLPNHSAYPRARNHDFDGSDGMRQVFERVITVCIATACIAAELAEVKPLRSMRAKIEAGRQPSVLDPMLIGTASIARPGGPG